jgi:TDG/mug DNA glycosylase family protein
VADRIITGLPPIENPQARVLVLGSMPGEASLQQQQYYAHPRNAFWPLMAGLLGFSEQLNYPERLQALCNGNIALWDVIGRCQRQGSLDSAIKDEQPNDFSTFFRQHPQLQVIAFNGAKAAQSFRRSVQKQHTIPENMLLITLPSTSPAHASLNFKQKLQQWQQLLDYL